MLKKLLNKKAVFVLSALLVVALAAGGTYAWLTARTPGEQGSAEFGELDIKGTFIVDSEDVLFEPGLSFDVEGSVKNTGTLQFVAKLDLSATSTLYRDADGKPLDPPDKREISPDTNVTIGFDRSQLINDVYFDENGEFLGVNAWYENRAVPGEYYLYMDPGVNVDLVFKAQLNGDTMGNEYMNAIISFKNSWFATQALNGAIKNAWGVSFDNDDLVVVEPEISGFSAGRSAGFDFDAYVRSAINR